MHAYVIDTGIFVSNLDFGGRATVGADFVGDTQSKTNPGIDCYGHGTHVAGTIGGSKYGVAKQSQLVAVRVLGCGGGGSIADVISGIDWVTANAIKPAVANMSLGGTPSATLTSAVQNSIASGVVYAVAAGNNSDLARAVKGVPAPVDVSACTSGPANVPQAITVAASTNIDTRANFSNAGPCVDVFAPGVGITSDWIGANNTTTNTISGTSMATPHVAGVAALYLAANPCAPPSATAAALTSHADSGVLSTSVSLGSGTPDLLLNAQFIEAMLLSRRHGSFVVDEAGIGAVSLSWSIPNTGAPPLLVLDPSRDHEWSRDALRDRLR
ncbi:MAG: S8 family peptidase [Acidimicrobiia bacterium]